MMNIKHHADDATLLSYAAGALPEGLSLVLGLHLESCDRCRSRLREAELIGGGMLEQLETSSLSIDSIDGVWNRIDSRIDSGDESTGAQTMPQLHRSLLDRLLPNGIDGIQWRMVAPGIRQHVFDEIDCERGSMRMFSIAPGTTIPHHGHGGTELTLVLRGSFADEIGRFGPGDLADLDDSVSHQPVADTDEPCICLIATDDRLRFSGMFSRLLQPLVGL